MESMSLIKYLRIYYGVNISKKNGKLTHNLIKKNMPFVKRCNFDYSLSNRDMLMCGEIVMVYDDTGAVLPYMVPEKRYVTYCDETDVIEEPPHKYITLEEAKKLPDYLLIEELHHSKHKRNRYKKLRDELLYERGRAGVKKFKSERSLEKLNDTLDEEFDMYPDISERERTMIKSRTRHVRR